MDIFLKITAGILIAAILCLVLSKKGSEISLLLCLAVCSIVIVAASSYLNPVLDFARKLMRIGKLNDELMEIILKTVGIGLLSQIVSMICEDIGNKSLSKVSQITATIVILCISVPILEKMLDLIEMVLGEI